MKKDIHPPYFPKAQVSCACGEKFEVGSTKEKIEVEICYKCHPFYTGEEKVIDIIGKVDKFKKRRVAAAPKVRKKTEKKTAKKAKKAEKTATQKPEKA